MIAAIRIAGKVKIKKEVEETLFRLKLRRKYVCVLINKEDKVKMGMLKKVRNHISYGEIEKGVLIRLIEKRGKGQDKGKIDADKILSGLGKGKKLEEQGLKGFFRLHPPRGGLKSSRQHFPKGVLGENKEISKLIEKML